MPPPPAGFLSFLMHRRTPDALRRVKLLPRKTVTGPLAVNFRLKSANPAADFRRHLRRLGSAKTRFPAKRHYALRAAAADVKRNRMRGLIIKLTARTRWRRVWANTMQIAWSVINKS